MDHVPFDIERDLFPEIHDFLKLLDIKPYLPQRAIDLSEKRINEELYNPDDNNIILFMKSSNIFVDGDKDSIADNKKGKKLHKGAEKLDNWKTQAQKQTQKQQQQKQHKNQQRVRKQARANKQSFY